MSEEEIKKETDKQYEILLAIFRELLARVADGHMELEDLRDIVERRVSFSFGYCCDAFNLDIEEALQIVKEENDRLLNPFERDRRKCLVAALENLIDFAVASQTQLYMDLEDNEDDEEEEIFETYNKRFAEVENSDINFMAGIAATFIAFPEQATLMYMTQGDERVRDSHRALEGLTFPKASFPEWLIPPIDWRCRCYLVESYTPANYGEFDDLEEKVGKAVNPVFKESLAKGGRIFSDEHPYFAIDAKLKDSVLAMSQDIKNQYNLT